MSRWKPFAWLLLFTAIALGAGFWELVVRSPNREADRDAIDWYSDDPRSFASLIQSVLPDSIHADFTRGMQSGRGRRDLQAARESFERALAAGANDHEDLLYGYAIVLLQLQTPSEQLEAAVTRWRQNFPRSQRPLLIPYLWYAGPPTHDFTQRAQHALADNLAVDAERVAVDPAARLIAVPVRGQRIDLAAIFSALQQAGFAAGHVDDEPAVFSNRLP